MPNKEICEIANDNSNGQVVVSGTKLAINTLNENLKKKRKKSIILPVSAHFHCSLIRKASDCMRNKIAQTNFLEPKPSIISNVTSKDENKPEIFKNLLVDQITSRVRWRESKNFMINKGVKQFVEIGPGKILSGLIKRIDKNVIVSAINNEEDIKLININD